MRQYRNKGTFKISQFVGRLSAQKDNLWGMHEIVWSHDHSKVESIISYPLAITLSSGTWSDDQKPKSQNI